MRKPATPRAGAFGLTGLLVSVRGKLTDKHPWGCAVIPMTIEATSSEQETTVVIMDAKGDEPKSRVAWTLSDDGKTLKIHALRLPKQDGRCTACATPICLQAHINAVDLAFSNIPNPVPPIGSIVECSNIIVNCSKGYASWNCQDLRVSAPYARIPAELAVALAMPYGTECLDLVGPIRSGTYAHTVVAPATPINPSEHFPAEGLLRNGSISPVIRLEVNRHLPRELTAEDDALRQRFILQPEGLLLTREQLAACPAEHVDAVTKIGPHIWTRSPEGSYGKFSARISLLSTFYGPGGIAHQNIAIVDRGLFAESFCANAGAIHPPLWEAMSMQTSPDLKDYQPILPHHLLVVPDYEESRTITANEAALADYEAESQLAIETNKPAPMPPIMMLGAKRVLGYIPRVCEYAHRYLIPVSSQLVRRRFDATGARPTDVYAPNDLYSNGPNKKFAREAFAKAQMTASGTGMDPTKMMDKELFERPWTFSNHVGWVVADWQPDMQWVDQILGDPRRGADWLWYAMMLAKPETKMPFGSVSRADSADELAEVRPLPGCALQAPAEGDAWVEQELKARYERMSDEKRRPFVGKHKNSAPLDLLADWKNIWMQSMLDLDRHTLPIMVFIAVRAHTKGMTMLGLSKKRTRDDSTTGLSPKKRIKNEREQDEGDDADEDKSAPESPDASIDAMELDHPAPPHESSQ
jgi:hypothetical protein